MIANCTIISSKRKKIKEKYFKGICLSWRAMMFRSLFQGKKKTSVYGCSLNKKKKDCYALLSLKYLVLRFYLPPDLITCIWSTKGDTGANKMIRMSRVQAL